MIKKEWRKYVRGNSRDPKRVIKSLMNLGAEYDGFNGSDEDSIYFIDHDGVIRSEVVESEMARIIMDNYQEILIPETLKESNQYLKIHEIEWIIMEDSLIQKALDSYDELNKQKIKNKMIIGVKIGEKIRELGITRHELAEKINMSDSQVDDLLSGDLNLTIDDITTIEQTLGITILGIRI